MVDLAGDSTSASDQNVGTRSVKLVRGRYKLRLTVGKMYRYLKHGPEYATVCSPSLTCEIIDHQRRPPHVKHPSHCLPIID